MMLESGTSSLLRSHTIDVQSSEHEIQVRLFCNSDAQITSGEPIAVPALTVAAACEEQRKQQHVVKSSARTQM
jgi:hypothetical protein